MDFGLAGLRALVVFRALLGRVCFPPVVLRAVLVVLFFVAGKDLNLCVLPKFQDSVTVTRT